MHIIEYRHIAAYEPRNGYIAIPELDRYKSSVQQFIALANLDITLTRPTAFLYVDGFAIAQSESGINLKCPKKYLPAIKTGNSYIMHEWIHTFKGKEHLAMADIISSTCASSLQAVYEAENLLNSGAVEEVIIIGGERTTEDTIRLFSELSIPIRCGDGFAYMRLGRDQIGSPQSIHHTKWKYTYQQNPFLFPKEELNTLMPVYPVDYVKLHGTQTESNNHAESDLATLGEPLLYKHLIGHSQGISCLLETCIVLDDDSIHGKVLVTANGLGGFYGAFTLIK